MDSETISKVEGFVSEFCSNLPDSRAAEKMIRRMKNIAVELAEKEDADEETVEIGSMLYGVAKYDYEQVSEFLDEMGLDENDREVMVECIDLVQSPCGSHDDPELRVIQSAEVLAVLSDGDWIEEEINRDSDELLMRLEKMKKRICVDSALETAEEMIEDIKKDIDSF